MIVKELDSFTSNDRLAKAGREAEEKMAFYLRRAFAKDKDILILNGLRLVTGEDAAQIDHLVIHRYGFIIIESKSISTRVAVNEHGEWSRKYGNNQTGMPSPIEQARRQAEFLHEYLIPHRSTLLTRDPISRVLSRVTSEERGQAIREKVRQWFHITTFGSAAQDLLVAISDSAIIDRPDRRSLDEVCKADHIPGRIRDIIERYRKANSLLRPKLNPFDTKDVVAELNDEERLRIAEFLRDHHRPVSADTSGSVAPPPARPPVAQCALCGKPVSEKVEQFCRDASVRFGGKVYCMTHQKQFPR